MGHVLRSTLSIAATFAAATAVARVTDSARRLIDEIVDDAPAVRRASPGDVPPGELGFVRSLAVEPEPSYHPFGPAPVSASRFVGFQPDRAVPEPRVEEKAPEAAVYVLESPADVPSDAVVPEALLDEAVAPEAPLDEAVVPEAPLDEAVVPEEPHDDAVVPESKPEAPPRLVVTGAVLGLVTNVHGRGLRGVCVEVVSADKTVVASTRTIDGGQFIVDGVPPGPYFLRAYDDVDGDFEKSWFGGRKFRTATSFMVMAGPPVDGIDVKLRSTAQIDVEATAGERKTEVVVRVTHRATGAPATGEVELSTKNSDHISVPLVDGQAYISFTDGDMPPVTKVRVFYGGDHQTRPASTKAKVR